MPLSNANCAEKDLKERLEEACEGDERYEQQEINESVTDGGGSKKAVIERERERENKHPPRCQSTVSQ